MKTLNRFLAQNNTLNLCFITDCCMSTKKKEGRGNDSFQGDAQKTQDLVTELVSTGETTKSDQDPSTLSLLQANILLLRTVWLSGSTAKENGKYHCISPYNKKTSCHIQVAFLLVPLSQMLPS